MTTFTQALTGTATPAAPTTRFTDALSAVRGSALEWRQAFRAAGGTPDRTGMDHNALLMFGRD